MPNGRLLLEHQIEFRRLLYLVMVFPKYAIYKDILAGNVGGDAHSPSLSPVTIQFDDKSECSLDRAMHEVRPSRVSWHVGQAGLQGSKHSVLQKSLQSLRH